MLYFLWLAEAITASSNIQITFPPNRHHVTITWKELVYSFQEPYCYIFKYYPNEPMLFIYRQIVVRRQRNIQKKKNEN